MKKVVSMLLCLAVSVLFGSTALAAEAAADSAFWAAAQKTAEMSSIHQDSSISMSVDIGGTSISITANTSLKIDANSEHPKMSNSTSMNLWGEQVKVSAVFLDDMCYLNTNDEKKEKYPVDFASYYASCIGIQNGFFAQVSPENTDLVSSYTTDAGTTFIFVCNEELLQGAVDSILNFADFGEMVKMTVQPQGVWYEATVDGNGYIINEKLNFNASAATEDQTITYSYAIDVATINPGQDVTIAVDNPDSYQLVAASAAA